LGTLFPTPSSCEVSTMKRHTDPAAPGPTLVRTPAEPEPEYEYSGRGRPRKRHDLPYESDTTLARALVDRLRDIWTEKDLSHEVLGRKVGVAKQTISKIATGKTAPSVDQVSILAKALGHHLHVVIRQGSAQMWEEADTLLSALEPARLEQVLRIVRNAKDVPLELLTFSADGLASLAEVERAKRGNG
jgi:ribosome-binding protein aMBF1 (putative translation factor)